MRTGGNEPGSVSQVARSAGDITGCNTVAYLRSLQAADDVKGSVRVLVHLEEEGGKKSIKNSQKTGLKK